MKRETLLVASMINGKAAGLRGLAAIGLAALLGALPLTAQTSPLVCSLRPAIECDETLGCAPYAPELPPPTFVHITAARDLVTILSPQERRGETTEIGSAATVEGRTILTGRQDRRGWSMSITDEDGAMSLTVSDDHVGFVLFGRCIASELLSP